jgi:WhiB family redox-sensing transcriptional regulator
VSSSSSNERNTATPERERVDVEQHCTGRCGVIVTTEDEIVVLNPAPDMPEWPDALCKQEDPDLWFPVDGLDAVYSNRKRLGLAVSICQECPRQDACADYAVTNHVEDGVWGGLTGADRRRIWAQDAAVAS